MENIQREMRNIKGNFMSLLFDRNNLVELNECLHEECLNNNEDIHKVCRAKYITYEPTFNCQPGKVDLEEPAQEMQG